LTDCSTHLERNRGIAMLARLPSDSSDSSDHARLPEVTTESLETLLALSPDALLVIDQAGLLIAASDQVCAMFGYRRADLAGCSLERLLPARFHVAHRAHRAQYLAAPYVRPMGAGLELLGRREDASEFPVDISLRPILLDGQAHVIAAIRDATERRAAERERALQAERLLVLSDFLNQAYDAILIRDPISRITSWNQAAERLYGWEKQEALGRISHVLLKTRFPTNRLLIETDLEQQGQWSGELVHTCRDGRSVLVESHQVLLRGDQGQPTAILEMNHAASVQRQFAPSSQAASAATAAQLTFFQTMMDALPTSIAVVRGKEACLLLANRASETLWGAYWQKGQSMNEFVNRAGITIVDAQGRACSPETWATVRAASHGEAVYSHQEVIRQPGGKQIPVLVHAVPLSAAAQWQESDQPEETREILVLTIHQDVTPLKEAEYLKDEFIGVAAHELRTPMAVLKSASSMLRVQTARGHGPQLADWQSEALQEIEQATNRLTDLTEDLLDVTRLQAGRLLLRRLPADLVALVNRVVAQLQTLSPHHRLNVQTAGAPLLVSLDSSRMEQVLLNIVGNAIKYSPRGGVVVVTVWEEERRREANVSVQDEGIGIPLHQQAQIFGRFMRADNARAAGIHGSGLGLYLCRELVDGHEGRVWFQSTEGQGTTFFLTLPLTPAQEPGIGPEATDRPR
jgi:PAS domain S-box-containing protein